VLDTWHGPYRRTDRVRLRTMNLGPAFSASEIKQVLENCKLRFRYLVTTDEVIQNAVEQLNDNRIGAWMHGRMEFGARALGNRSILADPRRADMKDVINSKVKFREPYRPFAPSVLEEDAPRFFHITTEAPFMTIVCRVRDDVKERIPAVTHVDGTARIQTISRTHNPRYWALVDAFKTLTGVPVVLNTSFNVRGEPIVCTPDDAVQCFLTTDIDCLVMGDYICTR